MLCPSGRTRMERRRVPEGQFWYCAHCDGRAVGMGVLRQTKAREAVNALWQAFQQTDHRSLRACPSCGSYMRVFTAGEPSQTLDACRACHLVWFDPKELEALPAAQARPEAGLSREARELLALNEVDRIAQESKAAAWRNRTPPDSVPGLLAGVFGMPVEEDAPLLASRPLATWSLLAFLLLVSLWAFSDLELAVSRFGFVPAEAFRFGGLTFLTAFFLHGSVVHLLGNLYFLSTFGDNVEDLLGVPAFLGLLLAADLAGNLAHLLGNPGSPIPAVGASGGISGILAFYALAIPGARIATWFWRVGWFRLPVLAWVGIWALFQVLGAARGGGGVAHLAHLGGAGAGVLAWMAWRATR